MVKEENTVNTGDWSRRAAWAHACKATVAVLVGVPVLLLLAPNWIGWITSGLLVALLALIYILWAATEVLIVLLAREGAELVARQIEYLDDEDDH